MKKILKIAIIIMIIITFNSCLKEEKVFEIKDVSSLKSTESDKVTYENFLEIKMGSDITGVQDFLETLGKEEDSTVEEDLQNRNSGINIYYFVNTTDTERIYIYTDENIVYKSEYISPNIRKMKYTPIVIDIKSKYDKIKVGDTIDSVNEKMGINGIKDSFFNSAFNGKKKNVITTYIWIGEGEGDENNPLSVFVKVNEKGEVTEKYISNYFGRAADSSAF